MACPPARQRFGWIIAALLSSVTAASAQVVPPTGSLEACLAPHGERERYLAALMASGWRDVAPDGRAGALAMLADAYLPVTGTIGGAWADHIAHRAEARAFWTDLAQNRTLLAREGFVLLLAGFRDDDVTMRVECWTAGPVSPVTDDFFGLIGTVYQSEGVVMTQVNLPATEDRPATELFVSRLTPPVPTDPPLAATDGLRTRIIFPMQDGPP